MNAPKDMNVIVAIKSNVVVIVIAFALCALGLGVLFVWHNPSALSTYSRTIVLMAYNTAICTVLSALALVGLTHGKPWLIRSCALAIGVLSSFTLLELISGIAFHTNYWFNNQTNAALINGGLMSPTTATCFALISGSLALLSKKQNTFIIPAVFLNLISLTITLIALLGYGIGLVPAFVWLGIKMAPQTAIGLSLCSLAILKFSAHTASNAFNQLSFFSRIATGFGFMAILVIAIGSIAFMQIHTVSSITHQLYERTLRLNNSYSHIKFEINSINRSLKNIAFQPESPANKNTCQEVRTKEQGIIKDINIIASNEPRLNVKLDRFKTEFLAWEQFVLTSCERRNAHSHEEYSSRIINEGQEKILILETMLEEINTQAQTYINDPNTSIATTEHEAKQLVIVMVLGFLIVGITVASLITRSLTYQLQTISRTMLAIADKQLIQPIPFLNHCQEIGDIARTLEIFQESFTARQELEARLLQVIEAMPNGIIMVNKAGIIEILNTQTERIFGYERNELIGKSVEQLIPQDNAKSHAHNRESFFSNPSPRTMGAGRELFGLRSDGTEFPLEIGLAPVDTKDGLKVLASIVDITERRNATIALNESRDRLELTTRINQIGVWEYDVDGGELIWNDAMFDIYGRNKEYFTYDYLAWKQCIHPNDIEEAEKLFQDSLKTLNPYFCKFRIVQPDGTIKYIHAKAKIERQTHTQKLRALGTNIDITREELAVAKLHNLEALRSAIVEFSEDAIISKTPTGIITSWNTGACNMFGYNAEEAIGQPIKDLIFPDDLKNQEDMLLTQVRAGMVIKHFETIRCCKDGRTINVSLTLSPIKDTFGNIVGISAIKRDITNTINTAKQLSARKQELEKSNHELERSNKELETFAYVASHDLKSPLRGIAQLSTWIEEDLAANEHESVKSHTELLRNRIKRMEKLLDDLLIFYRAGKTEGELVNIDLTQMMNDVFDIQNNKPGLKLENFTHPLNLITLSTPLELIIRNLFSNAIKHHDKQEGVIQVSTRELANNYIEISVSDDGPGIPEKFHTRIFGMFQTLKSRDELEGSGMGLALIKKIVENYGGYITLKSSGRGCCFSFSWPKTMYRW